MVIRIYMADNDGQWRVIRRSHSLRGIVTHARRVGVASISIRRVKTHPMEGLLTVRCLGECGECGEHLLATGRYTVYCPSCNTCPECGCPEADGFSHYAGCPTAAALDAEEEERNGS